ncbi:MAG: SCP2 sterol-binding domain-containing protein [Acidimicrobiales bacterium]
MSDPGLPVLSDSEIAGLVEGRKDAAVTARVEAMGTDTVLARAFATMAAGFLPERAVGASAVIQWELATPSGKRTWQVTVADGTCSVAPGNAAVARVTLALGVADFLRFMAGRLDGMRAFMTGRLRVSGDLMLAQAMQPWFSPPEIGSP